MVGQIFTDGNFQGIGNDGVVVALGTLTVLTTSTGLLASTWQDSTKTITNTNPITLSASGKAKVFLDYGTYDITLKDINGVIIWTLNSYTIDAYYTKTEIQNTMSYTVSTITDLATVPTTYTSAIVKDQNQGGIFIWSATGTPNGGTVFSGATGYWVRQYSGAVNVKWFGAVGDGVTDDTVAIQNAVNFSKDVFIPNSVYNISGTINMTLGGSKLIGESRATTVLSSSSSNLPLLTVTAGLATPHIQNMTLTRTATAISGGTGIKFLGSVGSALVDNLEIKYQYIGIELSSTDYSTFKDSFIHRNYLDGIYMTNTSTDGALQWQINNVLSQLNDRHGFYMQSATGIAGVTPGTWTNLSTYANTGRGIAVIGLAGTPINDIRILGGFFGSDGDSEIYLSTYGGSHLISGVTVERAGMDSTGRTVSTVASGLGSGIELTSNNNDIELTGCHSVTNSKDGYYTANTVTTLGNCTAKNNGNSLTSGRRNGLYSASGLALVTGGFYGNTSGTAQEYGVFTSNGNNLSVSSAYLSNTVAAFGATTNLTYISSIGNLPNNINVGIAPQGAVLVGGGATGDWNAAGTINVAGGLFKNDVAYNNP
jgi:multisubunit Na+/H+ antiporter MnhB subunit